MLKLKIVGKFDRRVILIMLRTTGQLQLSYSPASFNADSKADTPSGVIAKMIFC